LMSVVFMLSFCRSVYWSQVRSGADGVPDGVISRGAPVDTAPAHPEVAPRGDFAHPLLLYPGRPRRRTTKQRRTSGLSGSSTARAGTVWGNAFPGREAECQLAIWHPDPAVLRLSERQIVLAAF
jgi:hypothetical protein